MSITFNLPNKASYSKNYLEDAILGIFNTVYYFFLSAKWVAGIIGIFVVSLLVAIFIPIIYILMRFLNYRLKGLISEVYDWINNAEINELRAVHLEVERGIKKLNVYEDRKKLLDKNPLTMGISSQFNIFLQQFSDLESSLKRAAYPILHKDITKKELDSLKATFKNPSDWDDEELNVYEAYL